MNISLVSNTISSEGLLGEIHNFLRATAALDWHLGYHKDSVAALEIFSYARCLISVIHHVDGADRGGRVLKSLHGAFDLIVSQNESGSRNKIVVGNFVASLCLKSIVFRIDLSDSFIS